MNPSTSPKAPAITPAQHEQLARWLARSDDALRESHDAGLSEFMRCSAAFDAAYYCALYLVGPEARSLDKQHPSEKVLRAAAEVAQVDVAPGLLHLERQLWDPVATPGLSTMENWAQAMRALVPVERS